LHSTTAEKKWKAKKKEESEDCGRTEKVPLIVQNGGQHAWEEESGKGREQEGV